MRFSAAIFAAVVLAIPVISAPAPDTPRAIQKFDGETTGKYIIKLKDGVSHASVLSAFNGTVTHTWTIINGFAGEFTPESIDTMLANPDVEYISEDAIGSIAATQTNAPWGLGRLSTTARLANQNPRAVNFRYNYARTGRGVDVYVIDTGVRITHSQFSGNGAIWGANFVQGSPNRDEQGHGTHCAGTVAGSQWGVAKEARIIAVKVINAQGRVSAADFVSGADWVARNAASTRRPSVASMSLGFSNPVAIVDDAVERLLRRGVHAIIAAGNDNVDAGRISPARVSNAITVAASTIADQKAGFSNWGRLIDIFAPGQDIISAGFASDSATAFMSGTSMATPLVAGLVANLIARDGNVSPSAMETKLKAMGVRGQLAGVPAGTINLLTQGV